MHAGANGPGPDAASTGTILLSGDWTVLEADARACELLGRRREELLGAGRDTVLDPSDPRLAGALEQLARTGRFAGPLRFLKGDGGALPAGTEMQILPDDGAPRKVRVSLWPARAGEVDREVLFRLIVENASDIVSIYDFPAARLRYISPSVERVLGYTPEEAISRGGVGGTPEAVHPDDVPKMVAGFTEVLTRPGVGPRVEFRVRHKDGSWRHIEGFCNNLLHEPEVRGVVAVWRDVTERVQAQEEVRRFNAELEERVAERTAELERAVAELRESEERFRTTFEGAAAGIAHVAPDGRWLRVNRKLRDTLGYARDELLSLTFQDITHPDDLGDSLDRVRRLLSGEIDEYSIDKRYLTRNGRYLWTNLSVSLVRDPSSGEPSYFISVIEDIDERKRAELALRSLTAREREVLAHLARGRTNKEIAGELFVSERTAKFHVQNIIAKLGVEDRKRAAERAAELGLLDDAGQARGDTACRSFAPRRRPPAGRRGRRGRAGGTRRRTGRRRGRRAG